MLPSKNTVLVSTYKDLVVLQFLKHRRLVGVLGRLWRILTRFVVLLGISSFSLLNFSLGAITHLLVAPSSPRAEGMFSLRLATYVCE